ncbi:hypothetical protein WDU94_007863 [Cyamophila willieti]
MSTGVDTSKKQLEDILKILETTKEKISLEDFDSLLQNKKVYKEYKNNLAQYLPEDLTEFSVYTFAQMLMAKLTSKLPETTPKDILKDFCLSSLTITDEGLAKIQGVENLPIKEEFAIIFKVLKKMMNKYTQDHEVEHNIESGDREMIDTVYRKFDQVVQVTELGDEDHESDSSGSDSEDSGSDDSSETDSGSNSNDSSKTNDGSKNTDDSSESESSDSGETDSGSNTDDSSESNSSDSSATNDGSKNTDDSCESESSDSCETDSGSNSSDSSETDNGSNTDDSSDSNSSDSSETNDGSNTDDSDRDCPGGLERSITLWSYSDGWDRYRESSARDV